MQETRPMTQTAPRSGMAMAAVLATLLTACGSSGDAGPQPIEILSLSNRADMISDGNAYLEILLPKGIPAGALKVELNGADVTAQFAQRANGRILGRSEEHTSELQSPCNLVCRLLLEKKKKKAAHQYYSLNTIPHPAYP